jgi:hypothetical protein
MAQTESEEEKVEMLSRKVGGRFRLTALVQKQMAQYVQGGRTFMPDVRNLDELFRYVLDEIDEEQVRLELPGEQDQDQLEG